MIGKYSVSKSITKEMIETNIMIMEFDDDTIVKTLSEGEEYASLIPYRDKAFSKISISFADKV